MRHAVAISAILFAFLLVSGLAAQDPQDLLRRSLEGLQDLVRQNKEILSRLEHLEAKRASIAKPINCNPTKSFIFELGDSNWNKDIFSCEVPVPANGFLYLSLQGHQRSRDGNACSFGIFVDGMSINTASRNLPSHTYLTEWHPSFMSDTASVSSGKHTISLRVGGSACSIHDPDINGLFVSSGL